MRLIDMLMSKFELRPGDIVTIKSGYSNQTERYIVKRHSIKRLYKNGTIGEDISPKEMFEKLENRW